MEKAGDEINARSKIKKPIVCENIPWACILF
jgi:hypothetical protein